MATTSNRSRSAWKRVPAMARKTAVQPLGGPMTAALIALCLSCGGETRTESPDGAAAPEDTRSETRDESAQSAKRAATTATAATAATAKNIVFILLDDLDKATFDQLRAHPAEFPNIARLLAEGTYFTEAFVSNSVCCPSRATYLTGQYSHNNGTYALIDGRLGALPFGGVKAFQQRENESLAVRLDKAGYYTGHIGKYLNGYEDASNGVQPLIPDGWDEFHGLLDKDYAGSTQVPGSTTYNMDKYTMRQKYAGVDHGEFLFTGGLAGSSYQTEVIGQLALDFLDRWDGQSPFFLSLNPSAPHVETVVGCLESNADQMKMRVRPKGWQPSRQPRFDYGTFRRKTGGLVDEHVPLPGWDPPGWGTGSFDESDLTFQEKPRYLRDNTWDWDGQTQACTAREPLATLAGGNACQGCSDAYPVLDGLKRQHLDRVESMLAVDRMIGSILERLERHPDDRLRDETAILLTSDNGYFLGQHRLVNKQQPYEESIRVPLVLTPPRGAASQVGVSDDSMSVNTDWAPTILDYAGLDLAGYTVNGKSLDGRSLRAVAESGADLTRKRILLEHYWARQTFWDVPDYQGVRTRAPLSLYAEYYNVSAQRSDAKHITDVEYYTDAAQLDNLLAEAYASARYVLAEHLAALGGCSGASCRRAEDRMDPTYRVFLPVVPVQSSAPSAFPAGPGFYTGIAIQNLGTEQADVVVIFQDASSDRLRAHSVLVNPGGIQIVIPHTLEEFPLGFLGSAVITSNQPINAVVNLLNRLNGDMGISGGAAQAQYRGVGHDRAGMTVSFPLVKHRLGDKNTALFIQNAGHLPTTLTASFRCDGRTDIYSRTYELIEPRKMVVIRPQDVPLPSGSPHGNCAAQITSSRAGVPIAGVSLEYQVVAGAANPVTPAVLLQAANGFAPADHASEIHFPIVKRLLHGRTTGHQVQNVSNETRTVSITYASTDTWSGACRITGPNQDVKTLAPGASATFHDFQHLPTGCLTTAMAESSSSLAGIANEGCSGQGTCARAATTYTAIPASQLTSKLVAPMFKEDLGGKRTGMMLLNASSTPSRVKVTFTTSAGTVHTCTTSQIGAWQYLLLMNLAGPGASTACTWPAQGNGPLPQASVSSVSAEAETDGALLAAILNEEALDGSTDAANYEAVNVPR